MAANHTCAREGCEEATNSPRRKCCSVECRGRMYSDMMRARRPVCQREGCQQRVASRKREYCSRRCRALATRGRREAPAVVVVCALHGCDASWECSPSQVKHRRYCTPVHRREAQRRRRKSYGVCALPGCTAAARRQGRFCGREHMARMRGEAPIQRKCRRCGQLFIARAYRVREGMALYCSMRCYRMTRRSGIEFDVEGALRAMGGGLEFLPQQRWMGPSRRTYTADFRVMAWGDGILEVNGCHWHRHGCVADNGTAPLDRTARDARLGIDAKRASMPLAIVWECAIAEHGAERAVADALAVAGITAAA